MYLLRLQPCLSNYSLMNRLNTYFSTPQRPCVRCLVKRKKNKQKNMAPHPRKNSVSFIHWLMKWAVMGCGLC